MRMNGWMDSRHRDAVERVKTNEEKNRLAADKRRQIREEKRARLVQKNIDDKRKKYIIVILSCPSSSSH
jgi:hypothetical protein